MFRLERQVLLTYISWRWNWLVLPLALFMMLLSALSSFDHVGAPVFPGLFGIGMPILIGMQWFASIAKWQFANPRARLMPNYARPHLLVISAVLALFLVLNPLLQAFCIDISPLGPLAYSLLFGGLFLGALYSDRGVLSLPAMAVFISGILPRVSVFWFSGDNNYLAIHAVLVTVGAALNAWWLWKLATLDEEDEGYFIQPLGPQGNLSRLERVLQGRSQGGAWRTPAKSF